MITAFTFDIAFILLVRIVLQFPIQSGMTELIHWTKLIFADNLVPTINLFSSVNVSVTELNSLKTRINELQARVEDQVNLTTMLINDMRENNKLYLN